MFKSSFSIPKCFMCPDGGWFADDTDSGVLYEKFIGKQTS